MSNLRRRWAVCVVALVLLSWHGAVPAAAFPDLHGHWARQDIDRLAAAGLIDGMPEGLYQPEGRLTRAQFAKLMVVALGLGPELPAVSGLSPFVDVPRTDWSAPYVTLARDTGLFSGYGDGTFQPHRLVTRAEIAAVLVRALNWDTRGFALGPYADRDAIGGWAVPYLAVATARGLMGGYPGNLLRPNRPATRAEAAVFLTRLQRERGALYELSGEVVVAGAEGIAVRSGGSVLNLAWAPGASAYRNGSPAAYTSLVPGDELLGIIDAQGRLAFAEAHFADAYGRVTVISPGERRVTVVGPPDATWRLAAGSPVFRNGRPASLEELRPGDRAYLLLAYHHPGWARLLDAIQVDLEGSISEFSPADGRMTVRTPAGDTRQVMVPANARLYHLGAPIGRNFLRVGMQIVAALTEGGTEVIYLEARD
ncbi:MAG: S-layer homology domain-containing protein [Bacillota bacterium]